jgi:Bacterial dipeptidyl-peptidase Sh3 domain
VNEGFDPRVTPARADLAAEHLRGRIEAPHYVAGTLREVAGPLASLRRAPHHTAQLDTELLMGERLTVYEVKDGWAWGQAEHDGYVGYVSADLLIAPRPAASHRVRVPASQLYAEPAVTARALSRLSLGCRLVVTGEVGRFASVSTGIGAWFVPLAHLTRIDEIAADFVAVAECLSGVPYVWGGRSSLERV